MQTRQQEIRGAILEAAQNSCKLPTPPTALSAAATLEMAVNIVRLADAQERTANALERIAAVLEGILQPAEELKGNLGGSPGTEEKPNVLLDRAPTRRTSLAHKDFQRSSLAL